MKSAKLSPPDATRTGVCPAFRVGSPTSWMASAPGPERLVIIKALMQESLAGVDPVQSLCGCELHRSFLNILTFCEKNRDYRKCCCQDDDDNDGQDDTHSGLTMRGYSPAICHPVYT